MSILDVGAGASNGLETLLERMRAEELLRQRAGVNAEDVRHNKADEALRSRQLDESTASRRDTIARQILNDMQGDAEKRQSGYGVGATMGPKGVTFNEQEVPRSEAQKNMDVLGSSTLYHAPNVQGTSTMGVMPLIGAQGPTVQKSAPSTLTEPTPTMLFRGTGAQRLNAQKEAETEYKNAQAAAKPHATTAADMESRYLDILTRGRTKPETVTPDDRAFQHAYETNKKLVTDQSGANADARLAKTEKFQRQERGRAELGKVETVYRDASEKADVMRNATALARAGNVEASAMTPLLAALGVTTAEGVKRINQQEINAAAGAGSLLQRIRGRIGKWTTGQAIPPDVLDDVDKLASMLEASSYKKYKSGHATITKRYELDDESPLDAPSDGSAAPAELDPSIADLINRGKQPPKKQP